MSKASKGRQGDASSCNTPDQLSALQIERSGSLLSSQHGVCELIEKRADIPKTIRLHLAVERARQLEDSHDVLRRERGGLLLPR